MSILTGRGLIPSEHTSLLWTHRFFDPTGFEAEQAPRRLVLHLILDRDLIELDSIEGDTQVDLYVVTADETGVEGRQGMRRLPGGLPRQGSGRRATCAQHCG